jgi:hypothetical protein
MDVVLMSPEGRGWMLSPLPQKTRQPDVFIGDFHLQIPVAFLIRSCISQLSKPPKTVTQP